LDEEKDVFRLLWHVAVGFHQDSCLLKRICGNCKTSACDCD
jgi:hypothetical protein